MDNKLRETTNSCVEIWWIVGDKQRENLVTWYKSRLPFDLNVMLNLPSIKPQVTVVQATIIVKNVGKVTNFYLFCTCPPRPWINVGQN